MNRLRYLLAALVIWFFFFYNIERISKPINISAFVYIFAFVCAVLVILLPALQRMPLYGPFLMALPPYFFTKIYLGSEIIGSKLPITVTEVCAIWITIILSGQIGMRVQELWQIVAELTIGEIEKKAHPFEVGQGQIYREIRRARLYNRPAALIAISPAEESVHQSLDRFMQEAQNEIIHQYVNARIAKLLTEQLEDCDIIVQRGKHFVTLLPETDQERVDKIVKELMAAGEQQLGLKFKIGFSTFPDQAVTFGKLLEHAEEKMNSSTTTAAANESLAEPAQVSA